jgi:hypothetical protein
MARCRSNVAYPRPDRSPLAARVHSIAVEHDVLTGIAPPSRGCWFGSAEKRVRRDAETAGYSLSADSPSASVGIEDSIFQLDSCDTFELHKGGSCRLIYRDLIIFE